MSLKDPATIVESPRWLGDFDLDVLPGYESRSLALPEEDDGPLHATLVRRQGTPTDRPAVLYLHGFVDYFFQVHLADACERTGFAFYALDLRRHGRSLNPENRANLARGIDDYFVEIDASLELLAQLHPEVAGLVAHSTGALSAVLYAKRGTHRRLLPRLVLNSPFFAFRTTSWEAAQFALVKRLGRKAPTLRVPVTLNPIYGKTIHRSHEGEWEYDLALKPLRGFPFYAGWFSSIDQAQREVAQTHLDIPVLVLSSSAGRTPGKDVSPEDFKADTVLDPEDMKRIGSQLGPQVRLVTIDDGLHDLVLSSRTARERALEEMTSFLAPGRD